MNKSNIIIEVQLNLQFSQFHLKNYNLSQLQNMPKSNRSLFYCKKTILILIISTLLLSITQCQRGRGSNTGGGSSFGSSSSYHPSSTYYGSSSSSYGSGYGYRPGYGGGSGAMAGSIIGGICALFCCCGLCLYCCKDRNSLMGGIPGFGQNQNQPVGPGGPFDSDPMQLDRQFQRLKTIKNKVSPFTMSPQQYQSLKQEFLTIFNNPSSNFSYTQSNQTTRIINKQVTLYPQGQFIDRMQLQGDDEVGDWIGRGYFMSSENGPYLWWMKDYRDKWAAGQTGPSQFLIYQLKSYNRGYWTGRWFYQGDQFDFNYSGEWSLSGGIAPNNPFNIIANNFNR